MALKLQLDKRSKILLGVVVLVGALAAAWFLYLDDWLNAPPPAPMASAAKPAAAPAKAPASP